MPALLLPSTAGAATTGTASAKAPKAASAATKAPATTVAASAISPSAAPTASKQDHPEKNPAQRRNKEHQQDDYREKNHPSRRKSSSWLFLWLLLLNLRTRSGERDAGVLRDDIGNPRRHEQHCAAVVALLQEGNGFAPKAADFAVRQNRLQAVANFDAVFPVLHSEENQNSVIGGFAADAPLLVQVDGVVLNFRTVQGIDGHNRDLRVRFLFDLQADVIQLRDCALIENMGKVAHIVGRTHLRDRLGVEQERQRQEDNEGADRFH
jgi:hypothetical protein